MTDAADSAPLSRRLFAEFLGTGLLMAAVIGSGIAATRLSPQDTGLQLLENAVVTGLALTALIMMLGPVSGAHFNPLVSAADWLLGRRLNAGLSPTEAAAYTVAQCAGGIAGAVLSNVMFSMPQGFSQKHRATGAHFVSEIVATAVLIVLIFALARSQQSALAAPAVGAIVAAGYFFTSSTFFANIAADVPRMFSDTFAGIAPSSVPSFIGAQLVGLGVGVGIVRLLYPDVASAADDVVIPHHARSAADHPERRAPMSDARPTVLVSCIHNSGRSVAATGFLRQLAGDRITVLSRGSEPGTELNPQVVAAMAEVGIDVSDQTPTQLTDEDVRAADVVITMGCGETCTYYPGKRYEDWDVADPKGQDLDTVRAIRDEIRARAEKLVAELTPSA